MLNASEEADSMIRKPSSENFSTRQHPKDFNTIASIYIIILFLCHTEDPDRPCRVACQDETIPHRFYLVNGEDGWFPFGTDCSKGTANKKAYCISGKCLVSRTD